METVKGNTDQKERVIYLDILRVLSIVGVITIHTVAGKISDINTLGNGDWWWADILNGMTRWAVPVFFMISGVLTLESKQLNNIPKFIKSRFIKIGIPFLIWSVIYSCIMQSYILGKTISFPGILGIICNNILLDKAYYHLWFIYDIFIIYLISPLLKKIVTNSSKKEMQYWLGLWFIATIAYSSIQHIAIILGRSEYLYIHILNIPFVFGLTGYYILGYYLNRYNLPKKIRIVTYVSSVIAAILTIIGTYTTSFAKSALNENIYSHFSITIAIIAVGIFILAKNIQWEKFLTTSFRKLLNSLSNATFGIYLMHMVLIIHFTNKFNFIIERSYILYTIAIIVVSFVLSFFFVKLIRLIPKIGKYIV